MKILECAEISCDPAVSDDWRWAAVLARDPSTDGQFIFAVTSTGIYCRPSCPARRPKRGNVRFFSTSAEAEGAGFRACLRCQPGVRAGLAPLLDQVVDACRRMANGADGLPGVEDLAKAACLILRQFQRVFKAQVGISPRAFAEAARGERLREALAAGAPVLEALYAAGYGAPSRMYAQAGAALGMAPGDYRRGGDGETITYGVAPCSLGWVLVARSPLGVCALALGDDPAALRDDLARRFSRASLEVGGDDFSAWLVQALAVVEAPARRFDLPLDLRGTVFQQRVWRALRDLPPGVSVSYAELASRMGAPGAARAVGSACGANPVAVAVPCHRVVRGDGGQGGYRWGLGRKAALRARERDVESDD